MNFLKNYEALIPNALTVSIVIDGTPTAACRRILPEFVVWTTSSTIPSSVSLFFILYFKFISWYFFLKKSENIFRMSSTVAPACTISLGKDGSLPEKELHSIPCKIEYTGPANINGWVFVSFLKESSRSWYFSGIWPQSQCDGWKTGCLWDQKLVRLFHHLQTKSTNLFDDFISKEIRKFSSIAGSGHQTAL